MLDTDLKIAFRNIKRNKVQSVISILGLGIGLGSIILLMALIVHENSFDRFIPGYRNVNRIIFGQSKTTPFPLAEALKKDFPEVKDFFRFWQAYSVSVGKTKGSMIFEGSFGFSDTSIYKIIGIRLLAGRPANTVNEIAISKRAAAKYFGKNSPIGSVLLVKLNPNELLTLTVSGVYKDFPPNSTLYPEFIANISLSEKLFVNFKARLGEYGAGLSTALLDWHHDLICTYVVLDKQADKSALISKMGKYKEIIKDENQKKLNYTLQPVSEIYLKSEGLTPFDPTTRIGNPNELKYYWAISFLILLIAVTNYIFLTRAATSDRLRELGTRKIMGASRYNLLKQVISESLMVTILSLIPASFVIDSGITFIDRTLTRTLSNEVFTNPVMWVILITVVIFTGTISGLLIGSNISKTPSLLLLSGKTSEKSRSKKLDYSFLIFHFCIYIILVAGVLCVTKQVSYSLTNIKGLNPKNILVCSLTSPKLQSGFKTIRNEIEKIPGVTKIAGSTFIPPFNFFIPLTLANPQGDKMTFDGLIMGEGMPELMNMEFIEGSSFGPYQPPRIDLIFNESSAKKYNIKTGDTYLGVFNVKGIVKDFHSHSFHSLIQPMVILEQNPDKMGMVVIKTDGKNDKTVMNRLSEVYRQIDPEEIFSVRYLTDSIDEFYFTENNQAKILAAFSLLAAVLAIMGLFGIALISINRKTKEIGLRKVNGASVFEVIYLLNKDFIIWVMVSVIISIPLSFYLVSGWQTRFAYKTNLNWWIFAIASISAVLIAVLTVSWQSWRAATRNPVEALRYE
jgi:putative ABC transport system permease protein